MKKLFFLLILSSAAAAQQINPNQVNWSVPVNSSITGKDAIAGMSINGVYKAEQFSGATADVKIAACLAAAGAGTCDARGFGATTQTIAAQVVVGSGGLRQTLIFDPATLFQPSTASTNMFLLNQNGQMKGLHVVLPSSMTYAGNVITVNDNVREGNDLRIDGLMIDASAEPSDDNAAGNGIFLSGTDATTQSIAFAAVQHVRCIGLLHCLYVTSNGSGFVNGNHFYDIQSSYSGSTVELNSTGANGVEGNLFSELSGEADVTAGIILSGTGPVSFNIFSPIKIWDTSVGVSVTGSNAVRNVFVGSQDGTISDSNLAASAWPNQNYYFLPGSSSNIGWSPLAAQGISINASRTWGGAQNAMGLGWNQTGGSGEADYFTNVYNGGTNWAHLFYAPNSGETAYSALGGFYQNGTFNAIGGVQSNGSWVPASSGTATAGQLACIKSAGPPPVIGTCTAVSGATCTTCN